MNLPETWFCKIGDIDKNIFDQVINKLKSLGLIPVKYVYNVKFNYIEEYNYIRSYITRDDEKTWTNYKEIHGISFCIDNNKQGIEIEITIKDILDLNPTTNYKIF